MDDKYVIGLDYGSDSARALVVGAASGKILATSVKYYPRWMQGLYCNPRANQWRQHPKDYLEVLESTVKEALSQCPPDVPAKVVGIAFDTTGSTPAFTDESGMPLAMRPEFEDNPNAMFILWKDHTAVKEAAEINEKCKANDVDYSQYEGGIYSAEWYWAKAIHVLREDPLVAEKAYSIVEHCEWLPAVLTGVKHAKDIVRSRCACGHKAMWHTQWGGLPPEEFLVKLDPRLKGFRARLFEQTETADKPVGKLCPEWAQRLGLSTDVVVAGGAYDCHMGAVGAAVTPHTLVRVIGTSTCDIMVASYEEMGKRLIHGICGQVDGSVLPGFVGFEAGQSAFGDVYAWLSRFTGKSIVELTEEAGKLPVTQEDMVALDWFNGRRTPDADHRVKAAISGLTLGSTPGEVFKALVEATAFGSRAINERFEEEGIPVRKIVAVGGISRKSPYVMQTMADVMGMPVSVVDSDQTCALGAAMFAAVAAGVYGSVPEAQKAMKVKYCAEYVPNTAKSVIYNRLYEKYRKLGLAAVSLK